MGEGERKGDNGNGSTVCFTPQAVRFVLSTLHVFSVCVCVCVCVHAHMHVYICHGKVKPVEFKCQLARVDSSLLL